MDVTADGLGLGLVEPEDVVKEDAMGLLAMQELTADLRKKNNQKA